MKTRIKRAKATIKGEGGVVFCISSFHQRDGTCLSSDQDHLKDDKYANRIQLGKAKEYDKMFKLTKTNLFVTTSFSTQGTCLIFQNIFQLK